MPENVINFELLDFTMKYIKTNPEHHNQGEWFSGELAVDSGTHVADMDVCGTTGCFAGWASIFSGWHQVRPHTACFDCNVAESEVDSRNEYSCTEDGYRHSFVHRADLVVNHQGEVMSMRAAAVKELGFSNYQANVVFAGNNSRERLDYLVGLLHDNQLSA